MLFRSACTVKNSNEGSFNLLYLFFFIYFIHPTPLLRAIGFVCLFLITDGCEPPCSCWELNSGPLEEQSVLLTAEPSHQPSISSFLKNKKCLSKPDTKIHPSIHIPPTHPHPRRTFTSSTGTGGFLLVGQNPSWHRPAAISPKWRQKIKLPRDACCARSRRTLQQMYSLRVA